MRSGGRGVGQWGLMGGVRIHTLSCSIDGWELLTREYDRNMGQCQAAVAEAVEAFGSLGILFCCSSEGV